MGIPDGGTAHVPDEGVWTVTLGSWHVWMYPVTPEATLSEIFLVSWENSGEGGEWAGQRADGLVSGQGLPLRMS